MLLCIGQAMFFVLIKAVNKTGDIFAFMKLSSRGGRRQYIHKYKLYWIMIDAMEKNIKQRKDKSCAQ